MRLRVVLLIMLMVVLITAGCSQPAAEPEKQSLQKENTAATELKPLEEPVEVTVGMKKVVSDAGVLIGMAKGYYKELGITIKPVQFNSGQEMINSLAAGQLDVGAAVTSSGLFNAMLRGIPIKIVADKGVNVKGQGYYRLVIRKDLVEEIKDYKDLKRRKLGIVATASLDEIALDRVLNMGGMTTKDVDLQVIRSFPDILAALSNRSIDGGMLIEPFIAKGVEKGIIDPWKDPSEYDPHAQTALLLYGPSMMKKPEVSKRFMVAYVKSLRDYNDAFFKNKNKEEIIDVLVEMSIIKDKDLYYKMFPAGLNPNGYIREKGIELDLEWYKARGLLKGGSLTVEDVVDNSYVDFANKILGEY